MLFIFASGITLFSTGTGWYYMVRKKIPANLQEGSPIPEKRCFNALYQSQCDAKTYRGKTS